jgi:hypothetical protein
MFFLASVMTKTCIQNVRVLINRCRKEKKKFYFYFTNKDKHFYYLIEFNVGIANDNLSFVIQSSLFQ